MEYALVVALRVAHVMGGVMWVGAAFLLAGFVAPVAQSAEYGGFMQRLMTGRRASVYLLATAVTTVLSGIALYARMSALTDGAYASSGPGIAFGIGGAAGVAALLTGALGSGPAGQQLAQLGARLRAEGRPPTEDEARRMAALQSRIRIAGPLAMLLLLAAVVCMAVGRYV